MMRGAATGGAPSRADIEGGQVASNSLEGALAAGAGARGGGVATGQPRGQANPLMALAGQGGAQLGGVAQAAGARSGELAAARGGYAGAENTIRGQDYTGQGLAADRAEAQARMENGQRSLNDSRRLAYEQRSFDVNKAQQQGQLNKVGIEADQIQAQRRADAQKTSIGDDIAGFGVDAIRNFSDRNTKDMKPNALLEMTRKAKGMLDGVNASNESLKYGSSTGPRPIPPRAEEMLARVNAQRELLNDGPSTQAAIDRSTAPADAPRYLDQGDMRKGELDAMEARMRADEARMRADDGGPPKQGPLRAMMLKEPSAMPEKMGGGENPYAHKSLFGDAPEGYAASRSGHAGYMFGTKNNPTPEAGYGDLRSDRDGSRAPGSDDADHGEGHALSKKDQAISLSDEETKNKSISIVDTGTMAKDGVRQPQGFTRYEPHKGAHEVEEKQSYSDKETKDRVTHEVQSTKQDAPRDLGEIDKTPRTVENTNPRVLLKDVNIPSSLDVMGLPTNHDRGSRTAPNKLSGDEMSGVRARQPPEVTVHPAAKAEVARATKPSSDTEVAVSRSPRAPTPTRAFPTRTPRPRRADLSPSSSATRTGR